MSILLNYTLHSLSDKAPRMSLLQWELLDALKVSKDMNINTKCKTGNQKTASKSLIYIYEKIWV